MRTAKEDDPQKAALGAVTKAESGGERGSSNERMGHDGCAHGPCKNRPREREIDCAAIQQFSNAIRHCIDEPWHPQSTHVCHAWHVRFPNEKLLSLHAPLVLRAICLFVTPSI